MLKLFQASNGKRKSHSRTRQNKKATTTTSKPTTKINLTTVLDSFNSLQQKVVAQTGAVTQVTQAPVVTVTNNFENFKNNLDSSTTVKTINHRSRGRKITTTSTTTDSTLQINLTKATKNIQSTTESMKGSSHSKACPENLGACVDSCVPLQVKQNNEIFYKLIN